MHRRSHLLPLFLVVALLAGAFPSYPLQAQGPTAPSETDTPSVDSPPPEVLEAIPPPYVPAPALSLQVRVVPASLTVGMTATVTIVVSNQVADPADDLVVTLPVPAGAEALPDTALVSPAEGWRWPIGHLDGNQSRTITASLRLTSVPPGGALLAYPVANARLVSAPSTGVGGALVTLRPQDLRSPRAPRALIDPQRGGMLESRDRRVRVSFPQGASDAVLQVHHRTLAEKLPELRTARALVPPASAGGRPGFETFFLEATDSAGRDVHTFKTPLTISVSYTPEQLLALGIAEQDLTIFWFDETRTIQHSDGSTTTGSWTPLPTRVDRVARRAQTQVDHFTAFKLSSNLSSSAAFVPALQGWQTSLFTGAASYSYPLEVPTGAGGFGPNLQLVYTSDAADGSVGARNTYQATWVGRGWNFDPGGAIARVKSTKGDLYDSFTLTINGRSYDLVRGDPISGGTPGSWLLDNWRWYILDETFARVRAEPETVLNSGAYRWKVWLPDGTRYEFSQALRWAWKSPDKEETYKWLLTEAIDPSGNRITSSRWQTSGPGIPTKPYSLHPYQYAYSNPVLHTDPTGLCVPESDGPLACDPSLRSSLQQYLRDPRPFDNRARADQGYQGINVVFEIVYPWFCKLGEPA